MDRPELADNSNKKFVEIINNSMFEKIKSQRNSELLVYENYIYTKDNITGLRADGDIRTESVEH